MLRSGTGIKGGRYEIFKNDSPDPGSCCRIHDGLRYVWTFPAGNNSLDDGSQTAGMDVMGALGVDMMKDDCRFEIRRDGVCFCRSNIPYCGYSVRKIKEMISCGYRYYADGKMQRKIETDGGKAA